MIWTRRSRYHLESDTGHRVSKALVGERATYTAWGPPGAVEGYRTTRPMLGTYPTAAEAKRACEGRG